MSRPATQHKRAAYPSYKPSGVAWLGDVPEHWEVISVKRRYEIQLGKMLQNKPYSDLDVSVQYIKALHVLWGKVDTSDLPEMWASPTDLKQFNIKSGDLLVCEGGEAGRAGIVDSAPDPCIIQNALHRVRGNGADVRFLQYALKTVGSRGWFDALCNKATIAHFTREKLAELRMPTPTLSEQRAIAAFLDRETARIDTLIEKKRRQIELLQEKRSALISHAVTKGLDPNARMKDSGIEWLGDVPEHWAIHRLKYTASINDEALTETTDPDYEFVYVDIGSVDAAKGIVATETYRFEDAPSRARRIVRDGDTIVSTVRTYLRAIAPIRDPDDNMIVSTGFAVVRPRKLDSGYLSYALRSPFFVETVVSRSTGVSYPAINAPEVGNIGVTIPTLDEQRSIAAFLDRETARIDMLIEKVEKSIETLREYRTALISAAVTGKIDVRKEVS